jgi:hypothetical protein
LDFVRPPLGIEFGDPKLLRAVPDPLDTLSNAKICFDVTQLR